MVPDAKSVGSTVKWGGQQVSRSGKNRWSGQEVGIDVNPTSVVRPSASFLGPGDCPGRQKFLLGRAMPSEGLCIGDSHLASMEGQSGQVRCKVNPGRCNFVTRPLSTLSWTIRSFSWTHKRTLFRCDPEEFVQLFHRDSIRQDRLEILGHCSPKWDVLRSLQQVRGEKSLCMHHH